MKEQEIKFYEKQIEYIESRGYTVDNKKYVYLLPPNWFDCDDYELMTNILEEAIEKKCLVVDTDLYQENMMDMVIEDKEI